MYDVITIQLRAHYILNNLMYIFSEWRPTPWSNARCADGCVEPRAAREPHAGQCSRGTVLPAAMEGIERLRDAE